MRRRFGFVLVVAALGLGACGGGSTDGAGGGAERDPSGTAADPAPAGQPAEDGFAEEADGSDEFDGAEPEDSCGHRLVNLHDPVPGRTFADCSADAVLLAGTSGYRTSGDGSSAEGEIVWRDPEAIQLVSSEGIEVVVIEEQGWMYTPQGGWVVGDPNGTPPQVMAHQAVSAIGQLTTVELQRALFASSPEWEPVSNVTAVAGARAYSGTPDLMGMTPERYVVWLEDSHLPVRVEATLTIEGFTASSVDEFFDWGDPVEILPPAT